MLRSDANRPTVYSEMPNHDFARESCMQNPISTPKQNNFYFYKTRQDWRSKRECFREEPMAR